MTAIVETYVAMQHFNPSELVASELGASPAELTGNVEADRQRSWATGDHEAELRLHDTVYD